jgi:hypothetical protein
VSDGVVSRLVGNNLNIPPVTVRDCHAQTRLSVLHFYRPIANRDGGRIGRRAAQHLSTGPGSPPPGQDQLVRHEN